MQSSISDFNLEMFFSPGECEQLKSFCLARKSEKGFEPINFAWTEIIDDIFEWLYQDTNIKRTQKLILKYSKRANKNGRRVALPRRGIPNCLVNFIEMLMKLYPETNTVTVKLLRSEPECKRQLKHVDDYEFTRGDAPPEEMSLNFIVPLEDTVTNPTNLYVVKTPYSVEETIQLTQGSLFCFSSDFEHAGYEHMSNANPNYRLHFSIGTLTYPNDGVKVGIRDNWEKYSSHVTKTKQRRRNQ